MSILAEHESLVNESLDQGCPSTCQRRHEQLRRTLGLIDLLAAAVRHQTTHEIQHAYNELHGETWHWRTFERDLQFLEESGLVEVELRQEFGDSRTATRWWKLNLSRSESAQEAAIALVDVDCDVEPEPSATLAPCDPGKGNRRWTVFLVYPDLCEVKKIWTGLTKPEVMRRMKLWKEHKTQCLLIPMAEWLPMPSITFEGGSCELLCV